MTWRAKLQMQVGSLTLDVDLSGEKRPVALIGPNGAGKSTILRTIAGGLTPTSGLITVGDTVLLDTEADIARPPESRGVGYVPQNYALFPHLGVLDNIAFGLTEDRRTSRDKARQLLADLHASDLETLPVSALSSGEQQRIALARALILTPKLLLLDEPLAAMDATARRAMRGRLTAHLKSYAVPGLVVTHDVRDVRALDAHVYVIENGHVVQSGNAADLTAAPATAFVAEFFDSSHSDGAR